MIYSFFVRVPEAYASRPDMKLVQEKVYYIHEDHIGRPILISEFEDYDSDGSLIQRKEYSNCSTYTTVDIWRTNYTPFGVDDYSFTSAGIDVGSEANCQAENRGHNTGIFVIKALILSDPAPVIITV